MHPALGGYPAAPSCAPPGSRYKLARGAAPRRPDPRAPSDLDLAALATVCDLVPLRGENRRIVREGLVALARTPEAGAARADARRRRRARPS